MTREQIQSHVTEGTLSSRSLFSGMRRFDASHDLKLAFCIVLYAALFLSRLPLFPQSEPRPIRKKEQAAAPHAVLQLQPHKPESRTLKQAHATRPMPNSEAIELVPQPEFVPLATSAPDELASTETWDVAIPDEPQPTDQVLEAGTPGLNPPVFVKRVQPKYPPKGAAIRIQGYVVLQAILRRDGSVDEVEVLRGLGKGKFGFEQEAISSLRKWRFIPGSFRGQPADVRMNLRVDFILN